MARIARIAVIAVMLGAVWSAVTVGLIAAIKAGVALYAFGFLAVCVVGGLAYLIERDLRP